ncbi:hypothetical protein [Agrobacterium rubi]|uniref:Uncharacterized protein n=1 Tax=Agrobacterium rubi TaxID=28099 RepID=A0ABX2IXT7_9HYPH|nr:hypothetical protein [Agrobacterium rubi]NTF35556.1 hypothetical protein [Agrobacterium rubi]
MTPEQKIAAARVLSDNPLTSLLLSELEHDAIDRIIGADPKDHDTRAAYAGEVRAVRNFREKLNLLLEEATASGTSAPA